jgi:hypothetical protein
VPVTILNEVPLRGEQMPESFEIMHVDWEPAFEAILDLPPSFAGLFMLQIRRPGSDTSLLMEEPLLKPWSIRYPLRRPVPEDPDDALGTRRIAFGGWFNADRWRWNTDRLALLTRPQWPEDPIVVLRHYSVAQILFTVVKVEEGCDGEPKSEVYQDDCAVCGGDNSTCSGCDGIPNTGRDKGCSGHGECKEIVGMLEIKCECVEQWFDIMCSTFCDDAVHCSGHGIWYKRDLSM